MGTEHPLTPCFPNVNGMVGDVLTWYSMIMWLWCNMLQRLLSSPLQLGYVQTQAVYVIVFELINNMLCI